MVGAPPSEADPVHARHLLPFSHLPPRSPEANLLMPQLRPLPLPVLSSPVDLNRGFFDFFWVQCPISFGLGAIVPYALKLGPNREAQGHQPRLFPHDSFLCLLVSP